MAESYRIIVTKETILELESEFEAQQIADLLATRETNKNSIGGVTLIKSDYHLMPC